MTRVKLRVRYIGPDARGVPGDVVELADESAARLVERGRAVRVGPVPVPDHGQDDGQDDDAAGTTRGTSAGKATGTPRGTSAGKAGGRRTRRKPSAEDPFLNPDAGPQLLDPTGGRTILPPD